MECFDFHHHSEEKLFGIYNAGLRGSSAPLSSAGIHPKEVPADFEAGRNLLKQRAVLPNCVAIGECGVDALVPIPWEVQQIAFKEQILIANEVRKPIIVHCVRKFERLPDFIKHSEMPMIVHGFNKKATVAEPLLKAGFYFSFGAALLHSVSLQALVKDFPADRMFFETDASQCGINAVYNKAAELRSTDLASLQNKIIENLHNIRIL